MRPFGFNIIGHISANVGLGVIARDVIRMILGKGCPVATFDIDPGGRRSGHDTTYDYLSVAAPDALPHGISIAILSLVALPHVLIQRLVPLRGDVVNAGYFWWELPVIPDVWSESLEQFDVMLAGSQFLLGTFERNVSGMPAIQVTHGSPDFGEVGPSRDKFGIPHDRTTFICIVEPTSDPIRKNPYAAIEAFRRAFSPTDPAHLVIKLNNSQAAEHDAVLGPLRSAVAGLGSRVTLFEQYLPHREVIELYASCDVFVGLHRAEGLGLGLMEAMALAKPVIATGWSGSMTFMNHVNACLVGYQLVPVVGSVEAYSPNFLKKDVRWADPNLDEAAAWMVALAREPARARSIGRRAAEDMRRRRHEADAARFVDELRTVWEQARLRPPRDVAHREAMIARLNAVRVESDPTALSRMRKESRRLLDRHLLWRFRSR